MPFSLNFSGQFNTLGDFLSRLERFVTVKGDKISVNGRLLRVESISLKPGDGGWPALNAQIGASSYIVPETAAAAATGAGNSSVAGTPGSTTTTTTTSRSDEPPMNVILEPFKALWRRKLWPVAVAAGRPRWSPCRWCWPRTRSPAPAPANAAAATAEGLPATFVSAAETRRGRRAPSRAGRRQGPVRAGRALQEGQGRAQEGRRRRQEGAAEAKAATKESAKSSASDSGSSRGLRLRRGRAARPPSRRRARRRPRRRRSPSTRSRSASARSTSELDDQDRRAPEGAAERGRAAAVYRGVEDGGKVAVFELTGTVVADGRRQVRAEPGGLPDPQAPGRRDGVPDDLRHRHRGRRPVPARPA